ncbi:hypothetical protein Srot_1033 [Segniliparus rotundus DSM 44985]|uniref:Uncharacterized protein n=1 Tax=Segniliparus rotundus (strain ATCC BAA-972 / CDC 1076 / CIP 108378 / DSM 44985 / JCM 13578) TaxID=640132 RepID=D6ZEY2_SEGRD|nr:hypothetical protein Srot_1033 [Segniliparus rotundus DSM 44985]
MIQVLEIAIIMAIIGMVLAFASKVILMFRNLR